MSPSTTNYNTQIKHGLPFHRTSSLVPDPPTRHCACGTRLSRYNMGAFCAACELSAPPDAPAPSPYPRCQHCGRSFKPRRATQRYCRPRCQKRAKHRRYQERTRSKHFAVRRCEICEAEYWPVRRAQRFCSQVCRNKRYRLLKCP